MEMEIHIFFTYSTTVPTGASAGDAGVDTSSPREQAMNVYQIYQRNAANNAWVLHSIRDATTSNGVLFADITDTVADNGNNNGATVIAGGRASVYSRYVSGKHGTKQKHNEFGTALLGEMVLLIMQMVAEHLADMHNVKLLQLQCKVLLQELISRSQSQVQLDCSSNYPRN